MVTVREGRLPGNLPYLAFGSGPPLVVLAGLTPEHSVPTGVARAGQVRPVAPLARDFTVYLVNRRPGPPAGATIGDLAADYAGAISGALPTPLPVVGASTGGSIALQLAADHPDLVSRLALVAAACRLSEYGRRTQRRLAELLAAGRPRRAWAVTGPALAATPLGGRFLTAAMWLAGGAMAPDDPTDLITTVAAEDRFDLCDRLAEIPVPTLVIGGGRDRYYHPELFRRTATGLRYAWLRLYHRKGHAGTINSRDTVRDLRVFLTTPVQRRQLANL